MHHKRLLTLTLGAAAGLAALASPGTLHAFIYVETPDAGQTLATAAGPSSAFAGQPLTAITGSIATGADADLYRIFITNPATFSASTVGGSSLDTSLFLFDLNGRAIIANDDASGFSFQSSLAAGNATLSALGAGVYYLGISLSGNEPVNSANQYLFTQGLTTDVRTAAAGLNPTTLATFNGNFATSETGAYGITLTSATAVPEPSTWALAGVGALALGVALARRNHRGTQVAAL